MKAKSKQLWVYVLEAVDELYWPIRAAALLSQCVDDELVRTEHSLSSVSTKLTFSSSSLESSQLL